MHETTSYRSWLVKAKRKNSSLRGDKFSSPDSLEWVELYRYPCLLVSQGNFIHCHCHQYNLLSNPLLLQSQHALAVTSRLVHYGHDVNMLWYHVRKGTRLSPSLLFFFIVPWGEEPGNKAGNETRRILFSTHWKHQAVFSQGERR